MKLRTESDDIIGNNTSKSTGFTISASAKAFQILSSGIYKYKIRAVVREVVCNAVDAHSIVNNTTDKFTVKVPTEIDPRFIVRDFGPGLSHSDMLSVYTRYFESTKADRDDQIGAFGLGAKSPFSYTDTFSVTSFHNNVVTVYTAMLKNGEPQLVTSYTGPYEEGDRDGIEVTVPVKIDDMSEWHKEISYIMEPFPVKSYEIKGKCLNIKSFELDPKYKPGPYFTLSHNDRSYRGAYAVYGNIVYSIRDVPGLDVEWLLSTNGAVFFNFDMGQLTPQPSREEIQLDQHTIDNVIKKVNSLNSETLENDLKAMNGITNFRELVRVVRSLSYYQRNILDNANIKFNGKSVDDIIQFRPDIEDMGSAAKLGRVYTIEDINPKIRKVIYRGKDHLWYKAKISEVNIESVLWYNKTKAFVIIDDNNTKRIRDIIRGIALSKDENMPTSDDICVIIRENNPMEMVYLTELQKHMGGDEVVVLKTSELESIAVKAPKKPKINSDEVRPKSPNVLKYKFDDEYGIWSNEELFLSQKEVLALDGYCVGMYRDEIRAKSLEFNEVANISRRELEYLIGEATDIEEFYIVRPSIFEKVKAIDNMKCLVEVILNYFINNVDSIKTEDYIPVGINGRLGQMMGYDTLIPLNSILGLYNSKCDKDLLKLLSKISDIVLYYKNDMYNSFYDKRTVFLENMEKSKERSKELFKEFSLNNPLISKYINSYNFDNDKVILEDIISILKLKGII